jgi:16S rRNA (guanine966-N2)-methyltransferase
VTRIISGVARSRRLRTPSGAATRPTADRVREALFSSLDRQIGTLAGKRFLDVYAGSGAVGLEARSRGAAAVLLIESDRRAAEVIRQNANALALGDVRVIAAKAERLATQAPPQDPFDVAFFDPPYSVAPSRLRQVMSHMSASGWFRDSAVLVVERSRRDADWTWPPELNAVQSKRYGETTLWYGRVH